MRRSPFTRRRKSQIWLSDSAWSPYINLSDFTVADHSKSTNPQSWTKREQSEEVAGQMFWSCQSRTGHGSGGGICTRQWFGTVGATTAAASFLGPIPIHWPSWASHFLSLDIFSSAAEYISIKWISNQHGGRRIESPIPMRFINIEEQTTANISSSQPRSSEWRRIRLSNCDRLAIEVSFQVLHCHIKGLSVGREKNTADSCLVFLSVFASLASLSLSAGSNAFCPELWLRPSNVI